MTDPRRRDNADVPPPEPDEAGTYSPPPGARRVPIRNEDAPPVEVAELTPAEEAPPAPPEQAAAEAPPARAEEKPTVPEDELEDLRRRAADRDELENDLKRLAANFANAQKRIERETQTRIDYALQGFLRDILAVPDTLERALQAVEKSNDLDGLVQGLRMATKLFYDICARYHVEPIPAPRGQLFDPDVHQVVAVVPTGEYPEHAIVEVLEKGFKLKDRVVRPARVVVAKAPPAPAGDAGAGGPKTPDTR